LISQSQELLRSWRILIAIDLRQGLALSLVRQIGPALRRRRHSSAGLAERRIQCHSSGVLNSQGSAGNKTKKSPWTLNSGFKSRIRLGQRIQRQESNRRKRRNSLASLIAQFRGLIQSIYIAPVSSARLPTPTAPVWVRVCPSNSWHSISTC